MEEINDGFGAIPLLNLADPQLILNVKFVGLVLLLQTGKTADHPVGGW